MQNNPTRILKYDRDLSLTNRVRTGVSLHSHTMHSREYLGRLPEYISKIPMISYIIEREVGRLHLYTGRIVDFKRTYWTPPLSAREAFELERQQIQEQLGLDAMVSLSDHDNIEAGLHLNMLDTMSGAPISVEWSVPYERTYFHLGVHNLPAATAREWMERFARFTAAPEPEELSAIFRELNEDPAILLIFNHPYWDPENMGPQQHRVFLSDFLKVYAKEIHALEWNGLRSFRENEKVMEVAEQVNLPVVSGGDRHGCEPNAVLNLTSARTFGEFVQEIREWRQSEMILMPQYFEPLRLRLLVGAWHALSDAPGEFGRSHWMTRVYIPGPDGTPSPLTEFMGTRIERVIDKFRWVMARLLSPQARPAVRLAFLGNEEGGL